MEAIKLSNVPDLSKDTLKEINAVLIDSLGRQCEESIRLQGIINGMELKRMS